MEDAGLLSPSPRQTLSLVPVFSSSTPTKRFQSQRNTASTAPGLPQRSSVIPRTIRLCAGGRKQPRETWILGQQRGNPGTSRGEAGKRNPRTNNFKPEKVVLSAGVEEGGRRRGERTQSCNFLLEDDSSAGRAALPHELLNSTGREGRPRAGRAAVRLHARPAGPRAAPGPEQSGPADVRGSPRTSRSAAAQQAGAGPEGRQGGSSPTPYFSSLLVGTQRVMALGRPERAGMREPRSYAAIFQPRDGKSFYRRQSCGAGGASGRPGGAGPGQPRDSRTSPAFALGNRGTPRALLPARTGPSASATKSPAAPGLTASGPGSAGNCLSRSEPAPYKSSVLLFIPRSESGSGPGCFRTLQKSGEELVPLVPAVFSSRGAPRT